MLEDDLKDFFNAFYRLAYYINKADFSKMSDEQRLKCEKWLNDDMKKIYDRYDHTFCAGDFVDDCMQSLVRYCDRKIGFDIANKKGK